MPNDLFHTTDLFAREHKLSRSALITRAVAEFLNHHKTEGVTEKLNRVYTREESHVDPVLSKMQFASLSKERW